MSSIEIGGRLRQVRDDSGMNQRDFAARLGTSSGYISQIESGKNMPGGDFLLRLHQEFGVDVTWLLTGVSTGGMVPTPPAIPDGDRVLLDNFHAAPAQVQAGVKTTLGAFAPAAGAKRAKAG